MAAVSVFSSSPGTNANSNPPSTSSSYPPLQPQTSNPVEEHEKNESASNLSLSSSTSSIPNIQDTLQLGLPSLLHLSFNQEDQCFAAGTDQWIKIYNCHPFSEMHSFRVRGIHLRGTGVVEMLDKSYRFALIAGGSYPQYPPTKVIILDNHQTYFEKVFRSQVRAVRLTKDRIIVVLTKEIYIYNSSNMELLTQMETIENPKGLCVVSHLPELFLLVCPGLQKGQVRVRHFAPKMTKFISAHDSSIACLALSQDGKLLGTASTKGTLVRVFSTSDGSLLHEVRRGADRADIYSLAFSPTAKWLAVSSDKGTVHVFAVNINSGVPRNDNVTAPLSGSSFSIMKRVLPKYFSSKWSVAQFRLPEDIQYTVGFGHGENTIIIIGMDGSFYGCQFNPTTGGEMVQQEFYKFLSPTKTF